ncbi:cytochrome c oxidase subunit 5A, mitochondrial-like [Argiope bruennichi]|uniref:Cytochrome c oxidase subunit 5A, mitochondrial n=1 Tax=Argiope bruennichi TaxID=94029 RepID=A0A8T0F0T9_ARGBR|nr:cytochrome c oxidase subunit 5A, mitochondrial-like [Argiope bruennichi]KAF8783484.1 Cytochrome c oxidase subunit 5A like protein [Argiope bruennichi]
MFRHLGKYLIQSARSNLIPSAKTCNPIAVSALRYSSKKEESDEEFDARYEAYFNRPDIDEWEIRKAMNDLQGMDLVPEPKIIIAALKACRRLNDYALAVRFLEGVKDKCGIRVKEIYPYILQEIRPTLDELGVLTPEEMGYDKPELWMPDVWEKPMFRGKSS